jgi:cytochrome c oxidase subunit 2
LLSALLAAGGCGRAPSPLDPHTPATARIAELGWVMIVLATAVCVVVFAALVAGLILARRRAHGSSEVVSGEGEGVGNGVVVVGGMVLPAIAIAFTLGYTIHTLREVAGVGGPGGAHGEHGEHGVQVAGAAQQPPATAGEGPVLAVQVTGHQWWWEVRYPDEQVITANEIHVPAGVPIRLTVTSEDVIHSFWVPQVMGKVDVIPGRTNAVTFRVDQPGVYRGLCSEFCGVQHAHMHLFLVVDTAADFATWLAGQQRVPPPPTDSLVQQGQRVFLGASGATCAQCHTVRGTSATGTRGPNLTHVASRRTLGAGTDENTTATLTGWTAEPQEMKPGNKMPPTELTDAEVRAVVAYLETLR